MASSIESRHIETPSFFCLLSPKLCISVHYNLLHSLHYRHTHAERRMFIPLNIETFNFRTSQPSEKKRILCQLRETESFPIRNPSVYCRTSWTDNCISFFTRLGESEEYVQYVDTQHFILETVSKNRAGRHILINGCVDGIHVLNEDSIALGSY